MAFQVIRPSYGPSALSSSGCLKPNSDSECALQLVGNESAEVAVRIAGDRRDAMPTTATPVTSTQVAINDGRMERSSCHRRRESAADNTCPWR
jgi:hypothetical protein